jgi:hypothetical protein
MRLKPMPLAAAWRRRRTTAGCYANAIGERLWTCALPLAALAILLAAAVVRPVARMTAGSMHMIAAS